ncbi:MAG TPA: type II toxin-antitoxin system prevent-host-death family antitoxin [Candidatus Methylomirabilis sp.]|nr:type II toxin-antitoxin system prevent-host-death family antitoxin [Candidatus Methylomirabilis sp.]
MIHLHQRRRKGTAEGTKRVNALRARENLGQFLEEVYYKGAQYVIERAGRPMAVVVPVWQLEEWQKRRDRFLGMVGELWRKTKRVKPEAIERDVEEAMRAVHTKSARRKA